MAPSLAWRKMAAAANEKMAQISFWSPFFHFGCHVSAIPFQAWGRLRFSFPFSRDLCAGPASHSVLQVLDSGTTQEHKLKFPSHGYFPVGQGSST